jgi:RNA polymerase sigma factor (sigma-70 family)
LTRFAVHTLTDDEAARYWTRFQAGEAAAFECLAEGYYRALYNYGLRFSRDGEFIRDCIQELLLDLWAHRETLSPTPVVKAYLLKAFRHKLLKELARLARFHPSGAARAEPDFEPEPAPPLESHLIQSEEEARRVAQLQRAIAALPPRQQEIIYLKFYQQLEPAEIARVMDLNRQGVANLLYRALQHLRTYWADAPLGLLLFWLPELLGRESPL